MPEWSGAFKTYSQEHPGCGTPLADIQYLPPSWDRAYQFSASTVLVWADGRVFPCPEPPAPAPPVLFFEAWDGAPNKIDVGPILVECAGRYGVPMRGLVALIHAESHFECRAERWGYRTAAAKIALGMIERAQGDGEMQNARAALQAVIDGCYADGTPYDISFGLGQFTYPTAAGVGIGNGYASVDNLLAIRSVLFDPEVSIDKTALHFRGCLVQMDGYDVPDETERIIGALTIYNSGSYRTPEDSEWWKRWHGNVQSYRDSLALADEVLANKGYPGT